MKRAALPCAGVTMVAARQRMLGSEPIRKTMEVWGRPESQSRWALAYSSSSRRFPLSKPFHSTSASYVIIDHQE